MEKTPYRYGPPVSKPYFCDRETELVELVTKMNQGINLFVLSPRRYGKSSLIHRASEQVIASGGLVATTNLIGCTNEADVASAIASAVVSSVMNRRQRAKHSLEDLLSRIRVAPQVTVHPDGRFELTFTPAVLGTQWAHVLDDALDILDGAASDKAVVLVLDEFQIVADIGPKGLGGTFKALADRTTNASFIFAGSQLSVMEKLTSAKGAPLLGMGSRLVLDVIGEKPMCKFLIARADAFERRLAMETALEIYRAADSVPHYVQQLALEAFNLTTPGETIGVPEVHRAVEEIVGKEAGGFAERFETLVPSQRRFLKALAVTDDGRVYTKAFMALSGVSNSNSIKKTVDNLIANELVAKRAGRLHLNSPFMAHWLRMLP